MHTDEAGWLGDLVFTGGRDHPLPQAKYTPVQPDAGSALLLPEYVYLAKEALTGRIGATKVEASYLKVIETKENIDVTMSKSVYTSYTTKNA